MKTKHPVAILVYHFTLILAGAFVAAAALEVFLIPNGLLDGGVVGVAIMVSHLLGIPLGALTFLLNIPFLYIGYKQIGKTFLFSALFAIAAFSIFLSILRGMLEPTDDVILAAVFGGVILGAGVGLVIRFGGSLDGTEMVSIVISRSLPVSVGQCVLIFNIVIFGAAGFVFGFDKAMYSLLTYFIASRVIDIVVEGWDEAKCVMIVSEKYEELAQTISDRMGRSPTFLDGMGSYSRRPMKIIYVIVTRIELSKLKTIVAENDHSAFVTISNVADVFGGDHKKRAIH